jgi:hypothetical protein
VFALPVIPEYPPILQERKLQLLTFDGDKEREWVLDSVIRYIKVRVSAVCLVHFAICMHLELV